MAEFIPTPAADLRPGDMVDLEGDIIADPTRNRVTFNMEFQTVASVERETPNCVAVGIEGVDVFGFPPGHLVRVIPCPTTQIASPREFGRTELELARSLACYTSADDWGSDRRAFLQSVRDRIDMDLKSGEH